MEEQRLVLASHLRKELMCWLGWLIQITEEKVRSFLNIVYALLQNLSQEDVHLKYGDRVCQMIIEYVAPSALQEVHDLPKTLRGTGGFGSTGVSLKDGVLQENMHPDFDIPHTQ